MASHGSLLGFHDGAGIVYKDVDPWHTVHTTVILDAGDPEFIDEIQLEIEHPESCVPMEGLDYRCATEQELRDWPELYLPAQSGTFRAQVWWSGPDINGDYDAGCALERIA